MSYGSIPESALPPSRVRQAIVGYPKHARPILHEALWSEFRKIGAQPSIVCEIIDKSTLLQFVAHGVGIALAPAWVQSIAPLGVVFIPFEPCDDQIDLYVAFRKSGNSDTVERLDSLVLDCVFRGDTHWRTCAANIH